MSCRPYKGTSYLYYRYLTMSIRPQCLDGARKYSGAFLLPDDAARPVGGRGTGDKTEEEHVKIAEHSSGGTHKAAESFDSRLIITDSQKVFHEFGVEKRGNAYGGRFFVRRGTCRRRGNDLFDICALCGILKI